jgi:hypothetical protein
MFTGSPPQTCSRAAISRPACAAVLQRCLQRPR